jgi:hypothetical protein
MDAAAALDRTLRRAGYVGRLRDVLVNHRVGYLLPYIVAVSSLWLFYAARGHAVAPASELWDGQHYLAIAEHGYPASIRSNYSNVAFFPGLPIAIRFVHFFGMPWNWAGFIVSIMAGAVFCYSGSLLVVRRYGQAAARRASIVLAVGPGSFLFGTSYADPVAVALSVLSLLAIQRKHWLVAGGLGALAGLCSPLALPLAFVGVSVALKERGCAVLMPLLMPLGFVAYMLYVGAHTGNLTGWFVVERQSWGAGFDLLGPWQRVTDSAAPTLIPLTVMVAGVYAVGGLWAMWRARAPLIWWVLALLVLCLGLFNNAGWLNARYLLNAFPLTLATAVQVRGRKLIALTIVLAVMMELLLLAYTCWGNIIAQP